MNNPICMLTIRSKNGENSATEDLIKQFNPILKKYAFKLNYEDAFQDLLVCFIKSIGTISSNTLAISQDNGLVSYFQKTIIHSYINLSKKKKKSQRTFILKMWKACILNHCSNI